MRRLSIVGAALLVAAVAAYVAAARSTPSASGCGKAMAHFETKPYLRTIAIPPTPALTARWISATAVRVRWSFPAMPRGCRPVWMRIALREDANTPAFGPSDFRITSPTGHRDIRPPSFLNVVSAIAAGLDERGAPSEYARAAISGR